MKHFLLEKSYTKCGGETSPNPFFKKSKLSISLDHSLNFFMVCFCSRSKSRTTKYIATKVLTTCFYFIWSFSKKQRGLELASLPWFQHDFWRNKFFTLYFINLLTTNAPIIQKPVSWFAEQIKWLVSIWWEHWSLKG